MVFSFCEEDRALETSQLIAKIKNTYSQNGHYRKVRNNS